MRYLNKWALLLLCLVAPTVAVAGLAEITYTHTAVNVTTTSAKALAVNADRKWLLIVNDSDTVIYCKVGVAAVFNEGIPIGANRSSFEISPQNGNFTTGAINCIHGGTGNKVLAITEGT